MNVLYLRANDIELDPRAKKEIDSLLACGFKITAIVWNRDINSKIIKSDVFFSRGSIEKYSVCYKSSWGGGMKKNLIPFVKYLFKSITLMIKMRKSYSTIHAVDLITYLPALFIKFLFRKKIVYDIFDFYADTKKYNAFLTPIISFIEKRAIRYSDVTIICAEYRIKQISPSKPKKIIVIHNSPSAKQFAINDNFVLKSQSTKMKICYVGNLIPERFILEIINTIKDIEDIELHIGGVGILTDRINLESSRQKNVYFYGKMDYSEVLSLENKCDCLLALYDNRIRNNKYAAPNKFYEALYLGKPLIALRNTGFDNFVELYDIGVVIDDISDASLRSGILKIHNNINNGKYNQEYIKSIFYDNYEWDKMESILQKAYIDLVSKTPS